VGAAAPMDWRSRRSSPPPCWALHVLAIERSRADGLPPPAPDRVAARRLAKLLFSTMLAMADNRGYGNGEPMPRLNDTAVEEDRQGLPGRKRPGNQIVKTLPFPRWYSASPGSCAVIA
jgi:hypothetical protein